jgi:hypothetical protein
MAALIGWLVEASSSVWPSGSALATALAAIVVPAPGRFSTMTLWPSAVDISGA